MGPGIRVDSSKQTERDILAGSAGAAPDSDSDSDSEAAEPAAEPQPA